MKPQVSTLIPLKKKEEGEEEEEDEILDTVKFQI
jgi:uncharacterized protein (UPF0335 family)